ncbi:uncharacterized protein [Rutidosis leptorrhynchoides]|uniref:uncharacterized protein n=1 Tax=Rutidosis leptorrhynchoides TaxID=125765 RepID=UPI003A9A372D
MMFSRAPREGNNWRKAEAARLCIIAALIAITMFVAAVKVSGRANHQDVVFIIFEISDIISLIASITAFLAFSSVLITPRFTEDNFLVSLPTRMHVGLFSLMLSVIAMTVSYNATIILLHGHQHIWMLVTIWGVVFIPTCFVVAPLLCLK